MSNAVIIRRIVALEREVQTLKSHMGRGVPTSVQKTKKLSAGVQVGLRDIATGRVSGPFTTVTELMTHLEK